MRAVVRGTYHPNSDGSIRAHIVRKYCKVGRRVELVPAPNTPHDAGAMAVNVVVRQFLFIPKRFQIGYLEANTVKHFTSKSKRYGKVVKIHAPSGDNSPMVMIEIFD